jgi:hypothetical protein
MPVTMATADSNPSPSSQSVMSAADAHGLFAGVVIDAVVDLFRDYGVDLAVVAPDDARLRKLPDLISLAKFAGRDLSGCLVLGATDELIRRSGGLARSGKDWMAELANQLLGRVKNFALKRGIGFAVVPPAVVNGQHLVPATDRRDFQPTFLSSGDAMVCLWIELETASELQLDVDLAGAAMVSESDVLLF